jgi:uncharacterized protein YaiI (UPF0178 family)
VVDKNQALSVPQAGTGLIVDDGTVLTSGSISLPSHWGLDGPALENIRRARTITNLRHGLMANVPMICKAHQCPFVESCWIAPAERKIGMRCPIEIAAIIERFDSYCKALIVDPEVDIVDTQLVKDLVDLEIQMTRAEMKLAQNGGEFIDMVVAAVDHQGKAHYKPELSKTVEYKRELRKDHHRILQLLNSTRKDREDAQKSALGDAATQAAMLMQKFRDMQASGQIRQVIEVVHQVEDVEKERVTEDV